MPAFPATCYASDDYTAKTTKALEALDADLARQAKINTDIKEQFDALDVGEKARRMQAFMMKDPKGR